MLAPLIRKLSGNAPIAILRWMGNIWPPYLGAGIRIVEATPDFRYLKVKLKRTWWNANYVGTQFGGSIYAMVDPFYMMMILNNLGKNYIVWDKAAKIEFKRPGRSELFAEFRISEERVREIQTHADQNDKYVFDLPVEIHDRNGELIASVTKTLYVKNKSRTKVA